MMNVSSKKINILELHRSLQEKQQRKEECFDKIIQGCHHRIRMATDCKNVRCVVKVPEFIPGYPIYDMPTCMDYVEKSLKSNGFYVKRLGHVLLYISWDFDEMKKTDESTDNKNIVRQIPAISSSQMDKTIQGLNLSLTSSLAVNRRGKNSTMASLSKKNNGKLTLNLS